MRSSPTATSRDQTRRRERRQTGERLKGDGGRFYRRCVADRGCRGGMPFAQRMPPAPEWGISLETNRADARRLEAEPVCYKRLRGSDPTDLSTFVFMNRNRITVDQLIVDKSWRSNARG